MQQRVAWYRPPSLRLADRFHPVRHAVIVPDDRRAQPTLHRFGLTATVRAALAIYNTRGEIDLLAAALHRLTARRGR